MRHFSFLAAMLLAAMTFAATGCKDEPVQPNINPNTNQNEQGKTEKPEKPEPKTVTITFEAGENGEFAEGVQLVFTDTVGAAFDTTKVVAPEAKGEFFFNGWGEKLPEVFPENDKTFTAVIEHKYVDLGLSVMWATCNVGAEKPEDYGWYLAWGETAPQENGEYGSRDYKFGTKDNLSRYNEQDGKLELERDDDAATQNWGKKWRMPRKEEFAELINEENCECTWNAEKKGYYIKSKKNGNSIFLPAAGLRWSGVLEEEGSYGSYWSSERRDDDSYKAWNLFFNEYIVIDAKNYWNFRYDGLSVRPVCARGE